MWGHATVIMANVSIEVALKELIDAILKKQGVRYKNGQLRKLLEAAREILSEFQTYGAVLPDDSIEGYGNETAIGQLQIAVDNYCTE